VAGVTEDAGRERRAQREHQAAERPGRDQAGDRRHERRSQRAGHRDPGPDGTGPRAVAPDCLRHGHRDPDREREAAEEQPVDEPGRLGRVLDQEPGHQRSGGEPRKRRRDAHERPEPGVVIRLEVEQGGADGPHGDAGCDPLKDAGREQPFDVAGLGEEEHPDHLDSERDKERRAPTDVVGE
jgi:hypothetical protein